MNHKIVPGEDNRNNSDDPELCEVAKALENIEEIPDSCDEVCLLVNYIDNKMKKIVNKEKAR